MITWSPSPLTENVEFEQPERVVFAMTSLPSELLTPYQHWRPVPRALNLIGISTLELIAPDGCDIETEVTTGAAGTE